MLRIFFMTLLLLSSFPYTAISQEGGATQAARAYLNSGKPEQAIKTAQRVLKNINQSPSDRLNLLNLIAQAEIMRTTSKHFGKIKNATQAINVVLQEFPSSAEATELRWKLAWIHWRKGNHKQAITAAREIITQDQHPNSLRRAWLLMARIHILSGNFSYARSDLLQYGLQVTHKSRDQAIGMAWMAIIDIGEKRHAMAFKNFNTIFKKWPDLITSEPELFSAYIQLMNQHDNEPATLQMTEIFIGQYIHTTHAAPIRLIHADILAKNNTSINKAIQEYSILSATQAETMVGRQAFMRKLMLEFKDETKRDKLIPVMVSLKTIATDNQLSIIEDEAVLDIARLWVRLQKTNINSATKSPSRQYTSPALEAYARAATSLDSHISNAASKEGRVWMEKSIEQSLIEKHWLKAVTVWRQFPQLQPSTNRSQELRLGIAHAMRMLMLFDAAEEILNTLYKANQYSIRGERTMLELAKLWMDRQDKSGVKKVMRWLNRHEFSMYRPEMLLTVARMQLAQKHAEQARQTLSSVRPIDMTDASRLAYWQTKAAISESLSQWHSAARAWEKYRQNKGSDAARGLRKQAKNLFAAQEFAQAFKLFQQTSKENHNTEWEYHMGICQLRTGEIKQGTERLQKLAANTEAGRFSSLAKLALADKQAGILLGETP